MVGAILANSDKSAIPTSVGPRRPALFAGPSLRLPRAPDPAHRSSSRACCSSWSCATRAATGPLDISPYVAWFRTSWRRQAATASQLTCRPGLWQDAYPGPSCRRLLARQAPRVLRDGYARRVAPPNPVDEIIETVGGAQLHLPVGRQPNRHANRELGPGSDSLRHRGERRHHHAEALRIPAMHGRLTRGVPLHSRISRSKAVLHLPIAIGTDVAGIEERHVDVIRRGTTEAAREPLFQMTTRMTPAPTHHSGGSSERTSPRIPMNHGEASSAARSSACRGGSLVGDTRSTTIAPRSPCGDGRAVCHPYCCVRLRAGILVVPSTRPAVRSKMVDHGADVQRQGDGEDHDRRRDRPPDPGRDHRQADEQPGPQHPREHPSRAAFREPVGERSHPRIVPRRLRLGNDLPSRPPARVPRGIRSSRRCARCGSRLHGCGRRAWRWRWIGSCVRWWG